VAAEVLARRFYSPNPSAKHRPNNLRHRTRKKKAKLQQLLHLARICLQNVLKVLDYRQLIFDSIQNMKQLGVVDGVYLHPSFHSRSKDEQRPNFKKQHRADVKK
jgi:hypothetical protein